MIEIFGIVQKALYIIALIEMRHRLIIRPRGTLFGRCTREMLDMLSMAKN